MRKAIFDPLTIGDSKPISILVVAGDENCGVESVTYTITRYKDACGVVFDPGGACLVCNTNKGTRITTPDYIDFSSVDTWYVHFRITWKDGQVDLVDAVVPVNSLSGSGCGC